jgi:hypothetical protein
LCVCVCVCEYVCLKEPTAIYVFKCTCLGVRV